MTDRDERPPVGQASTGELIARATDDISTLIRTELQLAKEDLATSGKKIGIGAGAFGAAGTFALYGLGVLIAAGVLGLAEGLEPWLSALIVAAALFIVAAIAALVGKISVGKVAKPPRKRVASVQEDVATVKGHHHPGGDQ